MNADKIYAEQLVNEYTPKNSSKIVALRKLDVKAKLPATVMAYTLGIVSTLVMGTGMCFSMRVLGGSNFHFVLGIVLGVLGMVGVGINYLLYKKMLEKGKQKYAFEIVQLAKQISEQSEM